MYLDSCLKVKNLDFNDYKRIKIIVIQPFKQKKPLPRLDLPELQTLDLRETQITSFDELENSNLPNLNRLCICASKMERLPLLKGKAFEKLQVIEFRHLNYQKKHLHINLDISNIDKY